MIINYTHTKYFQNIARIVSLLCWLKICSNGLENSMFKINLFRPQLWRVNNVYEGMRFPEWWVDPKPDPESRGDKDAFACGTRGVPIPRVYFTQRWALLKRLFNLLSCSVPGSWIISLDTLYPKHMSTSVKYHWLCQINPDGTGYTLLKFTFFFMQEVLAFMENIFKQKLCICFDDGGMKNNHSSTDATSAKYLNKH